MKQRRTYRRGPLPRRMPRLERLEDRTLPSVTVVEPFEADLSTYKSALHFIPAADITEAAAHDGLQGLDKHDGYEWLIGTAAASQVHQGETLSAWVQFHNTADRRAYFGFGAAPANPNANSGSGRTLSLVLAPNTHQLMFQSHSRLDTYTTLAGAVAQDYAPDVWYRVEVVWGAGGSLTGRLYDSTGTKLLNSTTATNTAITSGNIAFRAFGNDKYFDTVVVDSDSTATPQEIVDAGGGLDPNWVPTDPPPPLSNGPSDGVTPIPWAYTSMPGTGRDIELQSFGQLQQVSGTGLIDDGTGRLWVVMAGANVSHNVGTVGVDWGPAFGAEATPMLTQYIFRQLPGENTRLVGVPADGKHFFAPDVLPPGSTDPYGSGLNWDQSLLTPGSELDPATGRLHRTTYVGATTVDGTNPGSSHGNGTLDHRLRVPVADLDPSQNPAGTRWFLMGNIYVEGDQDVTNNSRWVEITPHLSGTTFSFTYPNGAGGQLNFRTIPGLVAPAGPAVLRADPSGLTAAPVDHVRITFDSPIDPTTFDLTQVTSFTRTDASGTTDISADLLGVSAVGSSGRQFDVSFLAETAAGVYSLTVGPNILDLSGNPMDQDQDGTAGQIPDDQYIASFTITGPSVLSNALHGVLAGPVDQDRVVFSTPINPSTFTPDQYALTAPDGTLVNVTGITPVDGTNTRFDVTFDPQTAVGAYTLVIGPNITDTFGNPMGSPYMAQFTLAGGANRIINGGFETGNFMGWTQSGNTGATGVDTGTVHSGMYAAFLGPVGSEGFLSQTFTTTPGATYTLDYWLQHDGGSPSSFRALIDGVDIPGSVLSNPGAFGYTEYTFTFTATGPTTELKFGFREDPTYFHLDDVSVSGSPSPGAAGGAGHAGFVSATLSLAPAVGGGGLGLVAGASAGGSHLLSKEGDSQAAPSLPALGGGLVGDGGTAQALGGSRLPAPLTGAYALNRPTAAQRPGPRGTEVLDGLFARLGQETTEV
jgi:hypothetical protein